MDVAPVVVVFSFLLLQALLMPKASTGHVAMRHRKS